MQTSGEPRREIADAYLSPVVPAKRSASRDP